ncbi:MAG: hypothetical protein IPI50_03875 [Saprospiraceae bacterium]|nr:hypothetical protein [Saprospiraceae bacterium]
MLKTLIFLSIYILNYSSIFSQQIGISAAFCTNQYFDLKKDDGHFLTQYKMGDGFGIQLNLENSNINAHPLSVSFNLTKYDGQIMTRDGGRAGSNNTRADVTKYIVGLSIFLINVKMLDELELNFGVNFNYLLFYNMAGEQLFQLGGRPDRKYNLAERTVDILQEFNIGLQSRIGYNIRVYKNWYLVPEYNFYLGMTNEFNHIESFVKSYRQFFLLGLMKRFSN